MTPEQIIEHEAEELFVLQKLKGVGPTIRDWSEKVARAEWKTKSDFVKQTWRDDALSLNTALNSWGGCMKAEDQNVPWCDNDLPSALRAKEGYKKAGFVKTVPLPEKPSGS